MRAAWRQVKTLDNKMDMASKAAAQLDLLAQLPSDSSALTPCQPLSSNCPLPAVPYTAPQPPRNSNSMEIDTVQKSSCLLLDASCLIFQSHSLCFCCLKPTVPGTHVGSWNCPNLPVSMDQHKMFVDCSRKSKRAQIAVVAPLVAHNSPPHSHNLAFQSTLPQVPAHTQSPEGFVDFDEKYNDDEAD